MASNTRHTVQLDLGNTRLYIGQDPDSDGVNEDGVRYSTWEVARIMRSRSARIASVTVYADDTVLVLFGLEPGALPGDYRAQERLVAHLAERYTLSPISIEPYRTAAQAK